MPARPLIPAPAHAELHPGTKVPHLNRGVPLLMCQTSFPAAWEPACALPARGSSGSFQETHMLSASAFGTVVNLGNEGAEDWGGKAVK